MSQTTISIVAAVVVGGLAMLFVVTSARRDRNIATASATETTAASGRDVEKAAKESEKQEEATEAPAFVPPTAEAIGVSRRQFMGTGIVALTGAALASFGAASLAFLWVNKSTGFGGKFTVGKLSDILDDVITKKEPFYFPEGRFYIQPYPKEAVSKAKSVGSYAAVIPGMEQGVVALFQKCVHLGCKVPWCKSSQWFECPCHGSRYNRVGEKKGGPAPRGLDRFVVSVAGGNLVVDTGKRILGPPIGTNTTSQEAEGPHC